MRLVSADKGTGQFPNQPPDGGDGSTTRMLVRPVFTRGGDRRRRVLVRGGYVLAAGSLAYLAMVLVSITASPAARPLTDAAAAAPTTVRQVTPARPSLVPGAPVVAAPVTTARPRPPAVTPTPSAPVVPPVAVSLTGTAPAAPTSAATKTKKPKGGSKTSAPPKTTAAAAQPGA
jgi:hypothetical protein